MKLIIISPREFDMAMEMINAKFPRNLDYASGATIQYYYWEWTSHWKSYQQHGQGD